MTRLPSFLTAAVLALLASAPRTLLDAQEPDEPPEQEVSLDDRAMEWVGLLRREQFDSAATEIAPAVSDQLNADALRSGWAQITARFGVLGALEPGSRGSQGGYDVVNLVGTFGEQTLTVRVVYDEAGMVVGFFVLPPEGAAGRS